MKNVDFSEVIDFLEGPGVRNWQFTDSGIKLINIRNLVNDKINLENTTNHLSEEEVSKKYNHFLLKEGDYIMASSGVTWGKIAEVKKEHLPLCLNTSIIKLRPKYDDFEKKYLWYFIKSNIFTKQIDKIITGSAQPNFGPSHLKKVKIPLPPLPQQQKIANILDAADALRQNDKALIAKYDELTQALFLDMFGDPVSNPKGWKFKMLNELVSKLGDGLHGTPKYSEDGEYYFVNGNNLDNGKITISENTKRVDFSEYEKHKKDLNENTMLVSINGTIGKIAFYNNEKIILGKSACYFNLIKGAVNDIFLFHIFKSDYFLRYSSSLSTGSTIQNVSLKTMREFPIPIPPLDLQNQFAERVAVIEEQKAIAQKSLEQSKVLFNSLLQKAFKGELV